MGSKISEWINENKSNILNHFDCICTEMLNLAIKHYFLLTIKTDSSFWLICFLKLFCPGSNLVLKSGCLIADEQFLAYTVNFILEKRACKGIVGKVQSQISSRQERSDYDDLRNVSQLSPSEEGHSLRSAMEIHLEGK